jgi:hypothetical protein
MSTYLILLKANDTLSKCNIIKNSANTSLLTNNDIFYHFTNTNFISFYWVVLLMSVVCIRSLNLTKLNNYFLMILATEYFLYYIFYQVIITINFDQSTYHYTFDTTEYAITSVFHLIILFISIIVFQLHFSIHTTIYNSYNLTDSFHRHSDHICFATANLIASAFIWNFYLNYNLVIFRNNFLEQFITILIILIIIILHLHPNSTDTNRILQLIVFYFLFYKLSIFKTWHQKQNTEIFDSIIFIQQTHTNVTFVLLILCYITACSQIRDYLYVTTENPKKKRYHILITLAILIYLHDSQIIIAIVYLAIYLITITDLVFFALPNTVTIALILTIIYKKHSQLYNYHWDLPAISLSLVTTVKQMSHLHHVDRSHPYFYSKSRCEITPYIEHLLKKEDVFVYFHQHVTTDPVLFSLYLFLLFSSKTW